MAKETSLFEERSKRMQQDPQQYQAEVESHLIGILKNLMPSQLIEPKESFATANKSRLFTHSEEIKSKAPENPQPKLKK